MTQEQNFVISPEDLTALAEEIFKQAGVGETDARIVALSLVEANLRGTDSHGVLRIENYIKRLKLGGAQARPEYRQLRETAATIVLDADEGLGAPVSNHACQLIRAKALKNDLAFGVVRNSNHFGAASRWALLLSGDNMIGFCGSNVEVLMAAIGGKARAIGNNPLAVAVPAGAYEAVCLDMACSVVALGKALEYQHQKLSMPLGWFYDAEGQDTTDPFQAILAVPFGGHKGFGIAVIIELLSSLLAGGAFGGQINSMYGAVEKPNRLSHYFGAIRIEAFRELAEFKTDVDAFLDGLKNSPRKAGVSEIFYPGEIEAGKKAANAQKGVILPASVALELTEIARDLNVDQKYSRALTARPVA